MSYNDGGCCGGGGFSMPFAFTMPWGNGNGWGSSNDMFGWLMSILFISLFGFGGFGGGFNGRMPGMFPGVMPGAAGGNIAAETAAYVGAQNTADKVSSISTGVDAVAGIATANGVKIETVKDQNAAGFANLNTHLCEGFHSVSQQFNTQTMQGMNLHNSLVSLLNDMRAEQAKCCCETKFRAEADKCEILRAVADSEARITARMDAAEKAALQEKLAKANAIIATQKAEADNAKQTAQLMAAIQAQCGQPRACAPAPVCNPCAPYNRGCEDPVCTLVNSLVTRWANAQEIPAVPAAAA